MSRSGSSELDLGNGLLKEKLLHRMPAPGVYQTDIEGLKMSRRDETNKMENCFSEPIVALIVQGFKRSV